MPSILAQNAALDYLEQAYPRDVSYEELCHVVASRFARTSGAVGDLEPFLKQLTVEGRIISVRERNESYSYRYVKQGEVMPSNDDNFHLQSEWMVNVDHFIKSTSNHFCVEDVGYYLAQRAHPNLFPIRLTDVANYLSQLVGEGILRRQAPTGEGYYRYERVKQGEVMTNPTFTKWWPHISIILHHSQWFLSAREIADRTGLCMPSVHDVDRIADALGYAREAGFVHENFRDSTPVYHLTQEGRLLGQQLSVQKPLPTCGHPGCVIAGGRRKDCDFKAGEPPVPQTPPKAEPPKSQGPTAAEVEALERRVAWCEASIKIHDGTIGQLLDIARAFRSNFEMLQAWMKGK